MGRWLVAVVAIGALAGAGCAGSAEAELDRATTVSATPAMTPVARQVATTSPADDARAFERSRVRFAKKMTHRLNELEEQIDVLDEALAGRDPEFANDGTRAADAARAALETTRLTAQAAIAQAAESDAIRWLEARWRSREAVDNVEDSYYLAMNSMYQ